ncbi:MAG: ribosomal L7Ae/L30e/S12e/Gadd45 family protein [Clostridiales bacterium]|nr:ribosomal L7Ae/L30e/S12e/Gadd45 family protein [Clostridiales bacterium]
MKEDNAKLKGLLGMAMKAGRLVAGADRLRDRIRGSGDVYLALTASDASGNTVKRVSGCCEYYEVPYAVCGLDSEELGSCVGRGVIACVGITDARFYKGVLPLLSEGSVIRPKHDGNDGYDEPEGDDDGDLPPKKNDLRGASPEPAKNGNHKSTYGDHKDKPRYKPKEQDNRRKPLKKTTRSDATSGRRAKKT